MNGVGVLVVLAFVMLILWLSLRVAIDSDEISKKSRIIMMSVATFLYAGTAFVNTTFSQQFYESKLRKCIESGELRYETREYKCTDIEETQKLSDKSAEITYHFSALTEAPIFDESDTFYTNDKIVDAEGDKITLSVCSASFIIDEENIIYFGYVNTNSLDEDSFREKCRADSEKDISNHLKNVRRDNKIGINILMFILWFLCFSAEVGLDIEKRLSENEETVESEGDVMENTDKLSNEEYDDYRSAIRDRLFEYIAELTDDEQDSDIAYNIINTWEKNDLVLILMGVAKKEGIEIL